METMFKHIPSWNCKRVAIDVGFFSSEPKALGELLGMVDVHCLCMST